MPTVNVERLQTRRAELDLSIGDIADKLSMSHGYLRNVLCGADAPSLRVIHRLGRVLDLSVDEITAAGTTPQGDPSEPPVQPPNAPTHPPRRQDTEDTKGPKKAHSAADAA